MHRLRLVLPLVVLAFEAASSQPAWGQPAPTPKRAESADALLQRGVELRRKGMDEDALELFTQADAVASSGRAKAQRGLAEQALGRWVLAEQHVLAALAMTGEPWVEKNRAPLEASLKEIRGHLASLVVVTEAPGAMLVVDGEAKGPARDASVRVVSGSLVVEVRAPGFTTTRRTVDLAPGSTGRERFVLVREAPARVADGAPNAPAAPTFATPAASAPSAAVQAAAPPAALVERRTARPLAPALFAFGIGAAGAAVGTYYGVRTLTLKSDRDASCAVRCTSESVDLHQRAQTASTVSTIAVVAAVASVGVGTWLLFAPRHDAPSPPSVAFTATLGGGRLEGNF